MSHAEEIFGLTNIIILSILLRHCKGIANLHDFRSIVIVRIYKLNLCAVICFFVHMQLYAHKDATMVEHVQGQVFVVVEQVGQDTTVEHVSLICIICDWACENRL